MTDTTKKNPAAHSQTKTERSYSNQDHQEQPTSHNYNKNIELNHPYKKTDKDV